MRSGPDDPDLTAVTAGESFVGRRRELERLRAHLARLAAGDGALVLVAGEPGIGKTRLALQAARAAEEAGIPVRWGRCWEEGAAPSFWPWWQILGDEGDVWLAEGGDREEAVDVQLSISLRFR